MLRDFTATLRSLRADPGLRHRAYRTMGPGFPEEAEVYRGLSRYSLLFSRVTVGPRAPSVTVVLPGAHPGAAFAGVRTALGFAGGLARSLDRPLRVATTDPKGGAGKSTLAPELVPDGVPRPVPLVGLGDAEPLRASPDELWVITHWTTAHAADVGRRVGLLDPSRVIYLVQDYEAGFLPWSTDHALVRASYHAGFTAVVNSRPLADHLGRHEGVRVPDERIVAPALDERRLEQVAMRRREDGRLGVFFYARPSKPRNLYPLGASVLRRAAILLGPDVRRCRFMSAGERHPPLALRGGAPLTVVGQTTWEAYFTLLETVHVGLMLMYSPHPSHPPLELAVSGGRAVTNRYESARDGLHPAIRTAEADPEALALALVEAIREAFEAPCGDYAALADGALGRPLDEVVSAVAGSR